MAKVSHCSLAFSTARSTSSSILCLYAFLSAIYFRDNNGVKAYYALETATYGYECLGAAWRKGMTHSFSIRDFVSFSTAAANSFFLISAIISFLTCARRRSSLVKTIMTGTRGFLDRFYRFEIMVHLQLFGHSFNTLSTPSSNNRLLSYGTSAHTLQ
jgi:hypothetical protein